MENYNFYVINLRQSKMRRQTIKKMYDNKNLFIVFGYEGDYIEENPDVILPSNLDDIKKSKYTITNNEVGCTASHLNAIKTAYENDETEAFIIEDDTHNTYKSLWKKNLRTIIREKPNDADCIIFFTSMVSLQKELINCSSDFKKYTGTRSTGVYYINRNGMEKIYKRYIKNGKIDLSNNRVRGELLADGRAIYPLLKSYHYTKPTFIDECRTSTIHQRHVTVHEDNNNIIIDYFLRQEFFNSDNTIHMLENKEEVQEKKEEVQEKKEEVQEKKEEVQEESIQFTNQFGMDQLINYKISLLNQHKKNCYCEDCKILMNEIRVLLNEKKSVITKV